MYSVLMFAHLSVPSVLIIFLFSVHPFQVVNSILSHSCYCIHEFRGLSFVLLPVGYNMYIHEFLVIHTSVLITELSN